MTIVVYSDKERRIHTHYDDSLPPPTRFKIWVGVIHDATVHAEPGEPTDKTWQRVVTKIEMLRQRARRESASGWAEYADVFADIKPTPEQERNRLLPWVTGQLWGIARNAKWQAERVAALLVLSNIYGLDPHGRRQTELTVTRLLDEASRLSLRGRKTRKETVG